MIIIFNTPNNFKILNNIEIEECKNFKSSMRFKKERKKVIINSKKLYNSSIIIIK